MSKGNLYGKNIDKELIKALEDAQKELQDTVRQQQGMILKFIEKAGEFVHTLAYGELVQKIGFTPEILVGKKLSEVLSASEVKRESEYYQRAWNGEKNITYEGELNGVHYLASLYPIFKDNKVIELIVSCVDITERIESERRFKKIVEHSHTGVVIYNAEKILYTNPASSEILRENITGQFTKDSLQGNQLSFQAQLALAAKLEHNHSTIEQSLILRDGTKIEIKIAMVPIDYEGHSAILALFSDETKRRNAERTFEKAAKELQDINFALNESSIVAITNAKGVIQFANDKFCEISQYTKEELLGKNHRILNSGYHPKSFFEEMWKMISNGITWRGEIRNQAKDGTLYWVHTTIVPFFNEKGVPYQYIAIRTDITEQKKVEEALRLSEEKLKYMAFHDSLTGLPNRRFYLNHLEESLEVAKANNQKLAVVYMDMDRFKLINDTFGHDEGDEVLKKFAEIIQSCLPTEVVFARQGGDEFTMLFPHIREEEEVLQFVEKMIYTLQNPLYAKHSLTVSMGISFYPKDGITKDALLKFADKALYTAKRDGKNNYKMYNPEME